MVDLPFDAPPRTIMYLSVTPVCRLRALWNMSSITAVGALSVSRAPCAPREQANLRRTRAAILSARNSRCARGGVYPRALSCRVAEKRAMDSQTRRRPSPSAWTPQQTDATPICLMRKSRPTRCWQCRRQRDGCLLLPIWEGGISSWWRWLPEGDGMELTVSPLFECSSRHAQGTPPAYRRARSSSLA